VEEKDPLPEATVFPLRIWDSEVEAAAFVLVVDGFCGPVPMTDS